MKFLNCKCKLKGITTNNKKSVFELEDCISKKIFKIEVDESVNRILSKFKREMDGCTNTIYLTNLMTDIGITSYLDANHEKRYSLMNETHIVYDFSHADVLEILNQYNK